MTIKDLDEYPDDGPRREVIGRTLDVAAAPERAHQKVSGHFHILFHNAVEVTGWGGVYYGPVDVRFSPIDQVEPDLIVLRRARIGIHRGGTVFGTPEIVVEILSPSTRLYDLNQKRGLNESRGVPEFWIADPKSRELDLLAKPEGGFQRVSPDEDGRFRSTVAPDLFVDPATLFADLGPDWSSLSPYESLTYPLN